MVLYQPRRQEVFGTVGEADDPQVCTPYGDSGQDHAAHVPAFGGDAAFGKRGGYPLYPDLPGAQFHHDDANLCPGDGGVSEGGD